MTAINNNHTQLRAHKRNLAAMQELTKELEQLEKDQKKSLQSIDQQLIDNQKFLENVVDSSGCSVSYEEAFGEQKSLRVKQLTEESLEKYRPTKSSLFKMEVQLRKSLDEARFRMNCEKFFQRWKESLEKDF